MSRQELSLSPLPVSYHPLRRQVPASEGRENPSVLPREETSPAAGRMGALQGVPCDYYIRHFPFDTYGRKWLDRKGRAVHTQSDFMRPLYDWGDTLFANAVKI